MRGAALLMLLGASQVAAQATPTAGPSQAFAYDGFFTPQALASPSVRAVMRAEPGIPTREDILLKVGQMLPLVISAPASPVPSLVQVSYRFTSYPTFFRTNGMPTGSLRMACAITYSEDLYAAAGPERWQVAMRIGMADLFRVQYDQIALLYLDTNTRAAETIVTGYSRFNTPVPTPAMVPSRHAETESRRAQPQDTAILYVTICAEPHSCRHYVEEDDDLPGWLYAIIIPVFILLVFVFCIICTKCTSLSCHWCYSCCDCCYESKGETKEVIDEPIEEEVVADHAGGEEMQETKEAEVPAGSTDV